MARLRDHGGVLIAAVTLFSVLVWVSLHSNGKEHAAGFRRLSNGTNWTKELIQTAMGVCDFGQVPIAFKKVYNNVVCAKYADEAAATSLKQCALACSSQPGCSTFSYRDLPTGQGCRISACPSEVGSGAYCGKSFDVNTPSIEHQCYTLPSGSGALYSLQAFYVSSTSSECESQYVQFDASSPTCCAVACQSRQGCKSFSFSFSSGCRLSACGDGKAIGAVDVCGINRQCNNQSMPGSYMYTLSGDMKVFHQFVKNGAMQTIPAEIKTITMAPTTPLLPTLPPTIPPTTKAPVTLPPLEIEPVKPVVWKGGFLATSDEFVQRARRALSAMGDDPGKNIAKAAKASLEKMFPYVSDPAVDAWVNRYNASAFACTFQFGTDAAYFDKDYFLLLLHNDLGKNDDASLSIESLQAARTNIPCASSSQRLEKLPFERLGKSAVCFDHYRTVPKAANPAACSEACASEPGCVVFSYGNTSSCRISLCGRQERALCGQSKGGAATLPGQCSTMPADGSDVFKLVKLQVVGASVGCRYRYVPFPASNPLHCWQGCQAKRDCKAFSFGMAFGCRLSACSDPLAVGTNVSCFTGPENEGRCVAEAHHQSYLYALTSSETKGTLSVALPAGGIVNAGGGGVPLELVNKVSMAVCIVGGPLIVALLVVLVLKKLKNDDRTKEYMSVCQHATDICPKTSEDEPEGLTIKFSTEDGPTDYTFSQLPLSIAFWDTLPLSVCKVKENSEAERFGIQKGWIATHVNGKIIEGEDASEMVRMINGIALALEASGSLQRVTTDTES